MCNEVEHKYKCPRCSFLTCSLKCCKEHKIEYECSGVYEKLPAGANMLTLQNMSLESLRDDMKMLETGINLSNRAKKENCLAKVGASMILGIKPTTVKQTRKVKNLKHFLRKKRSVNYFTSPSPLFSRNKLNNTHVNTQMKPPCVFWTLELKFFAVDSQIRNTNDYSWA